MSTPSQPAPRAVLADLGKFATPVSVVNFVRLTPGAIMGCNDDQVNPKHSQPMNRRPLPRHSAPARSLPAVFMAGAGLACAVMSACVGPLAPRDTDRGLRVPTERVRTASVLDLESFKQPPVTKPTDATLGTNVVPERPDSRLTGTTTIELTIEQARVAALRNNLNLQVALRGPGIASASLAAEEAKFQAVLRASVDWQNNDNPSLFITQPNQQQNVQGNMGVDIPLRTGGRVSVDLTESWNKTPSNFATSAESNSAELQLSISQPLLRGAWRNVATASIAIAGYNQQIADAQTKLRIINEIAATDRAYWRLYDARAELDVRQRQYELGLAQLERAQRRAAAGAIAEIEVVRAQSGLASQLDAIITAESSVLLRQRELKRLINLPEADLAGDVNIKTITPAEAAPLDFKSKSEQLCVLAVAERMELLEAELTLLSDAVNIDVAKSNTLPRLDARAGNTYSGLDRTFWRAQRSLSNTDFISFSAGVTGEISLGNDAAESRLRGAVLTRLQNLATKAAREQTVRQEVLDVIDRLTTAWQRIIAARQSTILAGRTLAGEQRQFDVGSRTSTDVLDALTRLADSQATEVRALTEYQVAQTDLAVATGTVLGAARVGWEPLGDAPTGSK